MRIGVADPDWNVNARPTPILAPRRWRFSEHLRVDRSNARHGTPVATGAGRLQCDVAAGSETDYQAVRAA